MVKWEITSHEIVLEHPMRPNQHLQLYEYAEFEMTGFEMKSKKNHSEPSYDGATGFVVSPYV